VEKQPVEGWEIHQDPQSRNSASSSLVEIYQR